MKVTVRIVGVYFKFEAEVEEGDTVWDATEKAMQQYSGFITNTKSKTLGTVSHLVTNGDSNPTPTRATIPNGLYVIADGGPRTSKLQWQYYLNRPINDGSDRIFELVSQDNKAIGADESGQTLNLVKDNDTIIWRLLNIAIVPVISSEDLTSFSEEGAENMS